MIEPLRLSFGVDCEPEHAFAVWTERFGQWWPRAHSVSGDPESIILEPGVGGRIFERTADGVEIEWGEITAWDPPARLAYWWHIRRDRAEATHVDIRFAAADRQTTTVEIVHAGWDRLGGEGPAWRDANRAGWSGLVPHYLTACTIDPSGEERTP